MQVSSLTVEELTSLIRETVTDTIESLLATNTLQSLPVDPDEGAQLRPEVEQRLRESLRQAQAGEQESIPIAEVAKKLGLDWE